MTAAYCTGCVHNRRDPTVGDYCAYTLDERRNRPCKGGDGCTARLLLTGNERDNYINRRKRQFTATPDTPDWRDNDYIFGEKQYASEA